MDIHEFSSLLSTLTGNKRSATCFEAWIIEEQGRVSTVPWNNPMNISGPIDRNLPWFFEADLVESNNVVTYTDAEKGAVSTIMLIWSRYPAFTELPTDEEAIKILGEPDTLGEYWCPNKEYVNEITSIYQGLLAERKVSHELIQNIPHLAEPITSYRVSGGDTLSEIAIRFHKTVAELMVLNPWIENENVLGVGWELKV